MAIDVRAGIGLMNYGTVSWSDRLLFVPLWLCVRKRFSHEATETQSEQEVRWVTVMEIAELLTASARDRTTNRLRPFYLFVNQIAHSDLAQGMCFSTPVWRRTQGSGMGRSSRNGDVVATRC